MAREKFRLLPDLLTQPGATTTPSARHWRLRCRREGRLARLQHDNIRRDGFSPWNTRITGEGSCNFRGRVGNICRDRQHDAGSDPAIYTASAWGTWWPDQVRMLRWPRSAASALICLIAGAPAQASPCPGLLPRVLPPILPASAVT
jgi:hypothetical protein